MTFEQRVQVAIERMQIEGIVGWGLRIPRKLRDLGTEVQTGEVVGCDSDTCGHHSHDPAAGTYKWVPNAGRLIRLGPDGDVEYYVLLVANEEPLYIYLRGERGYHDRIGTVDASSVPDCLLAAVAT
jgi:hypothetical protein